MTRLAMPPADHAACRDVGAVELVGSGGFVLALVLLVTAPTAGLAGLTDLRASHGPADDADEVTVGLFLPRLGPERGTR